MKEVTEYTGPQKHQAGLAGIELGQWMGRREAFGLVAGRCSAADVESLRRIREDKMYRELDCSWAEFCAHHLHVARRSVDRAIGYLQEFGPAFFHVTQLAHIGPKEYRAIAQHVSERGVDVDGNVVALLPENGQKVAAAVTELLKRLQPQCRRPPALSFDAALKRCTEAAEMLEALPARLETRQKLDLASALCNIRIAAAGLGVVLLG
jgi:orotidine-5'-phosphate decarboxylase